MNKIEWLGRASSSPKFLQEVEEILEFRPDTYRKATVEARRIYVQELVEDYKPAPFVLHLDKSYSKGLVGGMEGNEEWLITVGMILLSAQRHSPQLQMTSTLDLDSGFALLIKDEKLKKEVKKEMTRFLIQSSQKKITKG